MSIITNHRKKSTTYTAIIRKGPYRLKPLTKTFPTKGEAAAWKAQQYRLISMKQHQDPRLADLVSLQDALSFFREHSEKILKKKATTLDREIYSGANLQRLLGKEIPLSSIDASAVATYQISRLNEGASTSAVRQELALLSRMFRTIRSAKSLPVTNPVDGIDRIPAQNDRFRFLSETEAAIIVAEAKKSQNPKFYPFVLLLLHTGMRTGEAARLTVNDIDLDRRLVTIRETKTKRPRTVGLSHQILNALQNIDAEPDGHIFLKSNHRLSRSIMLRPGCIFRDCWKNLIKRIDRDYNRNEKYRTAHPDFQPIASFRPHDLRHTAASHLLRQGTDIRIIADILGHSTLQMVMRYTHIFDDSKVEYADKLSHLGEAN